MKNLDWSLSATGGLPNVTERRDDVPLASAMLLWDDGYAGPPWCDCGGPHHRCSDRSSEPVTLAPIVMSHDYLADDPARYDNATGACFADWHEATDDERMVRLLRDAWMAVARDGVDAKSMHVALLAVPEFRAIIHSGELPECYRDE